MDKSPDVRLDRNKKSRFVLIFSQDVFFVFLQIRIICLVGKNSMSSKNIVSNVTNLDTLSFSCMRDFSSFVLRDSDSSKMTAIAQIVILPRHIACIFSAQVLASLLNLRSAQSKWHSCLQPPHRGTLSTLQRCFFRVNRLGHFGLPRPPKGNLLSRNSTESQNFFLMPTRRSKMKMASEGRLVPSVGSFKHFCKTCRMWIFCST